MAGAIVSAALLVPSTYFYTGRLPWEFLDALRDQGDAYRQLQEQLVATSGRRGAISAARALASPLVFAVLPLGILHWRSLNWVVRGCIGVTVVSTMIFSVLRGADKEIADLFIVGSAALLVTFGRDSTVGKQGLELLTRFWKPALFAVLFVIVAATLFTSRKDERLGGYQNRLYVCANDSKVCANLDDKLISWMPLQQRFGLTFFILSTSSGYYGLSLALEKPFDSTLGVGHSPAALSAYGLITGDTLMEKRTFTYRNRADGWSDEYYWSTLITWIANDVGFPGAVIVLALIAYFWGRWWREAAAGMSDPAAILFTLATMAMFYLPANNQLLASYDGYVTLGVWIAIWSRHRLSRRLSISVPA